MCQLLKGHLQGFFSVVSETGYSPPSTEEIQKHEEINLYSPVRLHDVVLNQMYSLTNYVFSYLRGSWPHFSTHFCFLSVTHTHFNITLVNLIILKASYRDEKYYEASDYVFFPGLPPGTQISFTEGFCRNPPPPKANSELARISLLKL